MLRGQAHRHYLRGRIAGNSFLQRPVYPDNLLSYIKKLSHADTIVVLATCDRDIIQAKSSVESSNIEHVWEWTIREFSNYISSKGIIITEQLLDDYIKMSYNVTASVS